MRFSTSLAALLPLVSSSVIPARHEPKNETAKEDAVLGVGIHFTMSYGIAAARYESGKIEDLVFIEGGDEYVDLMARLADSSYKQKCETAWEKVQCSAASIQRNINLVAGRPVTLDVGILAAFLGEVKGKAEIRLSEIAAARGQPKLIEINNVLPVFPMLPSLQASDIQDALQHIGLDWLTADRQLPPHIYDETNAALTGYSLGLCPPRNDERACARELDFMDFQHVLFLNFDTTSFSASLQYTQSANRQLKVHTSIVDGTLGSDSMPMYEIARAKFWARLQERIIEVVGSTYKPERVVLFGKYVNVWGFAPFIIGVLEGLEIGTETMVLGERNDGLLVSARGAAEMAGRRVWQDRRDERNVEEIVEL